MTDEPRRRLTDEERKARQRETSRAWYEANRDRTRENVRAWREANRDRKRETDRAWCEANRDRNRETSRAWYEANRDRSREANRAWREANPDRVRMHIRLNSHRRRALKAGSAAKGFPRQTIETRARIYKLFNNKCAYCGAPATTDDHVIALSQGGTDTPANIVPACNRCNCSKQSKPVEAWYLSQSFFDPERLAAINHHTKRKSSVVQQLYLFDSDAA